jgi:hypothetical protein
MSDPDLDEFTRRIEELRRNRQIKRCTTKKDGVALRELRLEELTDLMEDEAGYYFLSAAADLDRTALKAGIAAPEAQLVEARLRRAYVVQLRLPVRASFEELARTAIAHRARDLRRRGRAQVERLFRDRLKAEGVPIFMSPPNRRVPGLLIDYRKPDGVYPDPATGLPPKLYLEIKNINRVSDDIQNRLYEIAETSLEMKILYGNLIIRGFNQSTTENIAGNTKLKTALRARIEACPPKVVAFFICRRSDAERYRPGAEAFIDRLFFQEEVDECIRFIAEVIKHVDEQ